MKYIKLTTILLSLFMSGCLEIETLNKINQDGSIERTIELKGSMESINRTSFNIPRSDSVLWQISLDSLEEDKLMYRASRHFESVAELNQSYTENSGELRIKLKAELVRSSGLFFSRYHYREVIWADLPGPELSGDKHEMAADVSRLLLFEENPDSSSMDSVEAAELEGRLEEYLDQVIYADFLEEVLEGAEQGSILELIQPELTEHKDSLLSLLKDTDYQNDNQVWQEIMGGFIDSSLVRVIWENNITGFTHFYQSWQFFDNLLVDDFEFNIELPGVIKKTNAMDVRGNRLSWKPEAIFFFFGGVDLEAESTQINIWSVILTGILVLLTLVVSLYSFFRRGKSDLTDTAF